jgi:hypothetical protein
MQPLTTRRGFVRGTATGAVLLGTGGLHCSRGLPQRLPLPEPR